MIINKQGSTLQPQLQRIKIKIIIQVQSPQPVFIPQPQSFPPKNLLNIVPPLNEIVCITKVNFLAPKFLLYTTYYVEKLNW